MISDNQPGLGVAKSRFRGFDFVLVTFIALILAMSLINLFGATHGTPIFQKFKMQLLWVAIGWGVFLLFSFVDHRVWMRFAWWGMGLTIVAIALVPHLADVVKGSERWVQVGPVRVQPSEIAKAMTIIALARLAEELDQGVLRKTYLALRICMFAAVVIFIVMQPDLGTASMIALSIGSVALMMLRNLKPVLIVGLCALAMVPVLWWASPQTFSYQRERIEALVAADEGDKEKGWQSSQSKIAIGMGGFAGKGLGEGTQSRYGWLSEYWTDFPFSEWAEQTGFLFSAPLVLLYGLFTIWLLAAGLECRRRSDSVICFGAAALMFWHSFVNLAMGLGIAPVVGLTLPLFSYGGSSLVSFMAVLGLVSSVRKRSPVRQGANASARLIG